MKKILFLVIFLALGIAFIVVKTGNYNVHVLEQQSNANSSKISLSPTLLNSQSHSSAQSEPNADDLEKIKTAIWLRESESAVSPKLNTKTMFDSNDTQTNKHGQINQKESTPITTNDGIVIRPNKFSKAVVFDDGDKGLQLIPNQLGLPMLVGDLKYLNCVEGGNLPFLEVKRRAEAGDSCSYFDYALAGFANIDSLNADMKKDRKKWKEMMKPYMEYLLKAVIEGNYWAASELGCHYVYPPFEEKIEGLAWTIIGALMGTHGYIWAKDCTSAFLNEPEKTYIDAIDRAKFYIDFYSIKVQRPQ